MSCIVLIISICFHFPNISLNNSRHKHTHTFLVSCVYIYSVCGGLSVVLLAVLHVWSKSVWFNKPDAWRKMIGDVFIEELQNLGRCTSDIFYYSANSLPEVLAWRCTFWTNERNCVFTALTEFWFVNTPDGCRQRLFASSGMKRRILSVAPCNVWET